MVTTAASSPLLPIQNTDNIKPIQPKQITSDKSFDKMLNKEIEKARTKANTEIDRARAEVKQLKTPDSRSKIRADMQHLRNTSQAIQSSYERTIGTIGSRDIDENGMKIALKELAKKFQDQFHAILWNKMFKKEHSSLVEKIYYPQRTAALIESGSDELDDIGEQVYEELLTEAKQKQLMNDQLNNKLGGIK